MVSNRNWILNVGGCWVNRKDRCSYSYIGTLSNGKLVFHRGDGFHLMLTSQEFDSEMGPT